MLSEIFLQRNWFLFFVAFIWIIVAIVMDFRKREVANWWNFSLITIVLVYRGLVSVAESSLWNIGWGLIGLVIGFALANGFYYARMFAGGDAKLMIALGTILPLSYDYMINLSILIWFIILFLLVGGIYGILYSLVVAIWRAKAFAKNFLEEFLKYWKILIFVFLLGVGLIIFSFIYGVFLGIWFGFLILLGPILLVYAKSVENICLVKEVSVKDLTVGDWLLKSIKIGKQPIEPDWQGLSELELELIKQGYNKKVWIRYGIPFTPAFLFSFIALLSLYWLNFYTLIELLF